MNPSSPEPDFGATGQFELTGVFFVDKKADAAFATTLGMDRMKTLVLLGAGPAHLQVVQQLAQNRRSDVDVVLVAPAAYLTHGDLLANVVCGQQPLTDIQLDFTPWLRESGVRWVSARCGGLDAGARTLALDHTGAALSAAPRPALLSYDLLSIDTGAGTERKQLDALCPGLGEHGLPLWPPEAFAARWTQVLRHAQASPGRQLRVAVLGADARAVEMAFAVQQGLLHAALAGQVHLVTGGTPLVEDLPTGVQRRLLGLLEHRGIVLAHTRCTRVGANALELESGTTLPCDLVLPTRPTRGPQWLAQSGLALDGQGRVRVNGQLQSVSHKNVFATGEVASRTDRAQGGTDAVHAGPDLALNLLASLTEQPLATHNPPQGGLQVVGCGHGHAVAHWGPVTAEGAWAWKVKDKADRAFMARLRR
jgi:NADH dehydrogenase FAD-containing subunit